MKKQIIFLVVIIALVGISLCGCTEQNTALSGLEYSDTALGFGINPPEGWTTDENDQYSSVRFYGPVINDYTMNLGISAPENYAQGTTLTSLIEDMKTEYPNVFTDYVFVSSNSITINGMNAYDFIYTFTMGVYELKQVQYIVEKGGKASIITYTAAQDDFDDYISIVEESVNSFTIV
jgi:hypothetical protein